MVYKKKKMKLDNGDGEVLLKKNDKIVKSLFDCAFDGEGGGKSCFIASERE